MKLKTLITNLIFALLLITLSACAGKSVNTMGVETAPQDTSEGNNLDKPKSEQKRPKQKSNDKSALSLKKINSIQINSKDIKDMQNMHLFFTALEYEFNEDYDNAYNIYSDLSFQEPTPTIYMRGSKVALNKNDYNTAIEILNKATLVYPDNVELYLQLGATAGNIAQQQSSQGEDSAYWLYVARDAHLKAVELEPSESNIVSLINAHINLTEFDEAMALINTLIKERGLQSYYRFSGSIKLLKGDMEAGLADIATAAEADDLQALLLLADIYINEGKTDLALKYLLKGYDVNPKMPLTNIYLAAIYSNKGENEKAIKHYEEAARMSRDSTQASLYLKAANIAMEIEEYDIAYSLYLYVIDTGHADASTYIAAAYSAFTVNPDLSESLYDEAIGKFPDYTYLRKRAAYYYHYIEKPQKAIDTLKKIDQIEQDVDYFLIMAASYVNLNNTKAAINLYKEALLTNPHTAELYTGLATIYIEAEDYISCIAVLEEGLSFEPDSHAIQNFLSYVFAIQGARLAEATILIDKALVTVPDEPAYLDTKAWVEFKKGNINEAYKFIERAIKHVPDEPEILEHYEIIKEAFKTQDH